MLPLQEAIGKCGGFRDALKEAIACGRVIQAKSGHLDIFYFPRREFAREKLVKQELVGTSTQEAEGLDVLDKIDDADWEPGGLIADGLQELGFPGMPLPAASSTMAPPAPLTCPNLSGASYYVPPSLSYRICFGEVFTKPGLIFTNCMGKDFTALLGLSTSLFEVSQMSRRQT